MFNTSILFLSLSSVSRSPYVMIPQHKEVQCLSIENSLLSKFTSSFLQTYTNKHRTKIENTFFQHFTTTPLVFLDSLDKGECFIGRNQEYNDNYVINNYRFHQTDAEFMQSGERPFFINNCGDIKINRGFFDDMVQNDANSDHSGGGALFIAQDCNVILFACLFSKCRSKDHGGAIFICKKKGTSKDSNNFDFNDEEIIRLDTKYCCFQDCYHIENPKHGVAMLSAAKSTNLSYISTVKCPNDNTNTRIRSRGPQFDIQASTRIDSSNVNTTHGNSRYCSGIEYRKSNSGYFRFQTVTHMRGKFATSFTSINQDFFKIEYCNYVDNTVIFGIEDENNADDAALIHIKEKSATISHFYIKNTAFSNNKLNWRCKIFAKNSDHDGTVNVIDCYIDENNGDRFYGINLQNCHTYPNNEDYQFTTILISQLMTDDCQGVKTAEIIKLTPSFTASKVFTKSYQFSNSDDFSKSALFTYSFYFTKSEKFTETTKFTKSDLFTKTGLFSKSDLFSKSGLFTKTGLFTKSGLFTTSDMFTVSSFFTSSMKFSKTEGFSKTCGFTKTEAFSETGIFSISSVFTQSRPFTGSYELNRSFPFTKSKTFTPSSKFTKSLCFSETSDFSYSKDFTKSYYFSSSLHFSTSAYFNKTDDFSKSAFFSSTTQFSYSSYFSKSTIFTFSENFSSSVQFSSSFYFSKTTDFTWTLGFSKSTFFSKSDYFSISTFFTQSDELPKPAILTKTYEFSKSTDFTKSTFFTESTDFTKSTFFTESTEFTKSTFFTESTDFTKSAFFASSTEFSKSEFFSDSVDFSNSLKFTKTTFFSQSSLFTDSNQFTFSSGFTGSPEIEFFTGHFSKSSEFSNSDLFTKTSQFTKSSEFTFSGKFKSTSQFSKSMSFSRSNIFSYSSLFSPSQPEVIILIRDQSNQDVKYGAGKSVGIAVAAAAFAALIIAAIFFIYKKRKKIEFSAEAAEADSAVEDIHYDNPLYNTGHATEDPFAEDFDEIENVFIL